MSDLLWTGSVSGGHRWIFSVRMLQTYRAVLRVPIGDLRIIVPGNWGVLARADTGRVWFSGESSDRWHSSIGAGVWWHPADTDLTINFYGAKSSETTRGYLLFGRGF